MAADFKAVIFDFDGTLYDNSGIGRAFILSNPFRIPFLKAERDARKSFKGRDFETPEQFKKEFYGRAASNAKASPAAFAAWYEKRYMPRMERVLKKKKFRARKKVFEVFKALAADGKKIALYSDYPHIRERAAACGVAEEALALCQNVYSSDDFGCLKPAPRAFLKIAADLGARPKDCLVVGDRDDTDGFGARLCQMKFVQIKTKSPRDVFDFKHPVMEWDDFSALVLAGRAGELFKA